MNDDAPIGTVICRRRSHRRADCTECGRPSDVLCDGVEMADAVEATCDRPLCRRCAFHVAGQDRDLCSLHRPDAIIPTTV